MSSSSNLTPKEIVSALDRFIIGQNNAKKAVAIALRNRWRRQQVEQPLRDEITPKNIIMIGPTGVGKTEIARRLARLASAPFIKVEASKFTEVGYIGKDVESMIRELTDLSVKMVREEEQAKIKVRAQEMAEEKLLDLLLADQGPLPEGADPKQSREALRELLRAGKLDKQTIELPSQQAPKGVPMIEVLAAGPSNLDELGMNLKEMMGGIFPQHGNGRKKRKVKVSEARDILSQEESAKLIDMESVTKLATERVEQSGIVFLDEIDKIVSRESAHHGPDVSREGVQRDILPIVEGSTVMTKHGMVKTDHILFIAAGAFHVSKPSDLIPELQGRFPIRVELDPLVKEDFYRILTETDNSLVKQYIALMDTEGIKLTFTDDGLKEICEMSAYVNEQMENIGARRLHTIMEKVLDTISFDAPSMKGKKFTVDAKYVRDKLSDVVKDRDLSKYIL
ncbi:MAG: HslU--HslV peptidase ATPase subunit [Deltaproteobacteria bacterium CG11_big_fil_rev_8_21_14_0_20_49_13]|nr:MAG: HslU--HslV peptidase ATPase subunit [Deltaproteobacteria bacterium CG11_big_fil_rev_8_21_14_0_20_49_13]